MQTSLPVNRFPDYVRYLVQRLKVLYPMLGIRPRFGAVGQHGSIAVVERFIQTVKVECTRRLLVSFRAKTFRQELLWFAVWYNQHRPHTKLGGGTPDEICFSQRSVNQSPRFEPRALWPQPAPCALPQVLVKGQPAARRQPRGN